MDPLLLIPGLGSDAAVWQPTIDRLAPVVDCTVGDTLRDTTLPAMAARIVAAAPERFALAGVSMGGMVALEIVRAAPERVTRLALLDTNAAPDTPEQAAYRRYANAAMLAASDLRALAAPVVAAMVHPSVPEAVRTALVEMTVRVGADAYVRQNEAVAARADFRPLLGTVQVPTLVIVGADDPMTPPAMAAAIAEGIAGARLNVIPECGHLPPIERPEAVAALLRGWLEA